jgi:chromosome segregation ATPase
MHSKEKEFFEAQIKELKDTEQKLKSELDIKVRVEEALMEKENDINLLKKELASVKDALSSAESQVSAAEASRAELPKLKNELVSDSEKLMELVNKNSILKTKVESLKEDLGERGQRISKYEEDAKRLNDTLRNLEVEATTSKRYVKEKDAELKKTNAKVTRQEKMITELKDSVSKLEIERNDLAKKVENYEKLL